MPSSNLMSWIYVILSSFLPPFIHKSPEIGISRMIQFLKITKSYLEWYTWLDPFTNTTLIYNSVFVACNSCQAQWV